MLFVIVCEKKCNIIFLVLSYSIRNCCQLLIGGEVNLTKWRTKFARSSTVVLVFICCKVFPSKKYQVGISCSCEVNCMKYGMSGFSVSRLKWPLRMHWKQQNGGKSGMMSEFRCWIFRTSTFFLLTQPKEYNKSALKLS